MNEQEQISQLSALFDGELPRQQADMVIRRALRDAELRASWARYALIGACLRGGPVASRSLAEGVQASLANERDLNVSVLPARRAQAGGDVTQPRGWIGRGALGGAIAAGVAVISIFVMREMTPDDGFPLPVAGGTNAVLSTAVADTLPAGYTTPGTNAPAMRGLIDASLGSYLVAHSEGAASALRSSYELALDGVELTEDQIRALR